MSDLLLRRASEPRPGAKGLDDYDVIGMEGGDCRPHLQGHPVSERSTMAMVAGLRFTGGPHTDAWRRGDARDGHAGVREELASGKLTVSRSAWNGPAPSCGLFREQISPVICMNKFGWPDVAKRQSA